MLIFMCFLIHVRSGFSLKGVCDFHTSEGGNTCGPLGRKTTGTGVVTFRYPGGFVMLPDAKARILSPWSSSVRLLLISEGETGYMVKPMRATGLSER